MQPTDWVPPDQPGSTSDSPGNRAPDPARPPYAPSPGYPPPPGYPPLAGYPRYPAPPARRRGRAALTATILGLVLVAAIGTAAAIGLQERARHPATAAVASTAGTSAPSASEAPDSTLANPTGPQYRALQLSQQIGPPQGFATVIADWADGSLHNQYGMHCRQGACPNDPAAAIAAWAVKAGVPAGRFTAALLKACMPSSCVTGFPRDGFDIRLIAYSAPDTSYHSRSGDVVYLADITISPA